MKLYMKTFKTDITDFQVICTDNYIINLSFGIGNSDLWLKQNIKNYELCGSNNLCEACEREIRSYLAGKLKKFTVPIKIYATLFQQKIYNALKTVPYGTTVTYGQLTSMAGVKGARAVGGAVSRNPIPIIVPCHRVIRSDGMIGGFCGKSNLISLKQRLLEIEGIAF
ncbi:hypothetical protein CCDG5_1072 [[Clostridium] cellulosi]|jgi:O-6-methylguanine DNA methyltransferase|uniref:methylated-DNA--[protein]-cysteine S-methyltransferase n=1 Tax=[Clostridium] cellulosi TaxID=29343 RepID=A0A078KSS2_9FIRM|nr:hypothetical protein CCDG5_1072 [[Clostridium] cellulosi]